ncbi:MAG: hypothetical protein HRU09_11100 [Oligoflexales bacterium]|nr:hypothetical protein [Oligoflexales bacterium]
MRKLIFLLLLCFSQYSIAQQVDRRKPFIVNPKSVVKDILKRYKFPEEIPWNQYFDVGSKSEGLLYDGLFQEAEWTLAEEGNQIGVETVHILLEEIMRKGEVLQLKDLGMGGATKPKAATLPYGVIGVFKEKKYLHPSANYRSEIAAYEFDQLLGFHLVPMTVKRKIKKRKGSMQYFVKNSNSVVKITDYERSKNLNVFDYLISNKDRNEGNLLIANGREIAIDHGLALRGANLLGRYLKFTDRVANSIGLSTHPIRQVIVHPKTHIEEFQADRNLLDRLDQLTLKELKAALDPILDEKKIYRIYDKKNRLMNQLIAENLYDRENME